MVKVVMTGDQTVQSVKIDPAALDPEDIELLEDMIVAALNEASRVVSEKASAKMQAVTGGLNIGGVKGREAAPWYVVGKDVASNTLTIDQGVDSLYLMSMRLLSEPAHWIAGEPPAKSFECTAQTRYRQPDEACRVDVREDGGLLIHFNAPQRAVTPGQSVVLYLGDECLGGAVIAATDAPLERSNFDLLLHS